MHFTFWILLMKLSRIVQGQNNAVVVRAIKNTDARLPCGQGKVFLDGPESFVLWIKNDREILYRYPTEGVDAFESMKVNMFCVSSDCPDDITSLFLKHVNTQDAGIYTCRIHYQASPSVDYVLDLQLVESPGIPKIYLTNGKIVIKEVLGPFGLGSQITLNCKIENDQPETLLFWRRNGRTYESANDNACDGFKCAVLNVFNMTRDEQGARYECVAQNSDVSRPLVSGVVIKMFLPPLLIQIRLNDNLNFEAGQPRVVDCVVVGCMPPPSITWHLGNNMLRSNVHKELHDGNYTVSSLTLAPSYRDTNRQLVCKAHNSLMPEQTFQDNVTLNVGYRPVCASSNDVPIGIVEGEAELVTCTVEATPAPILFNWTFFNSRTISTSVQKVPNLTNRYTSTLIWVPYADDIGELHCLATNIIGVQKQPCIYTITQGGPPSTPDCEISKSQLYTVRVQCKKTWDGGRPHTIHLDLLNGDGKLLWNMSDSNGNFRVPNIQEPYNITAVVYATNIRGRSENMVTQLITKNPQKQQVYEQMGQHWIFWIELVVTVLCISFLILFIIKCVVEYQAAPLNQNENMDIIIPDDDDLWIFLTPWRFLTGIYILVYGIFHREPDFTREERIIGTTNITVNQVTPCQNDYTTSPIPGIRHVVRCSEFLAPENVSSTTQHTYYV